MGKMKNYCESKYYYILYKLAISVEIELELRVVKNQPRSQASDIKKVRNPGDEVG